MPWIPSENCSYSRGCAKRLECTQTHRVSNETTAKKLILIEHRHVNVASLSRDTPPNQIGCLGTSPHWCRSSVSRETLHAQSETQSLSRRLGRTSCRGRPSCAGARRTHRRSRARVEGVQLPHRRVRYPQTRNSCIRLRMSTEELHALHDDLIRSTKRIHPPPPASRSGRRRRYT